jgi:hypothetical protein
MRGTQVRGTEYCSAIATGKCRTWRKALNPSTAALRTTHLRVPHQLRCRTPHARIVRSNIGKCMVMVGTRWEVQFPQCLLHTNRAKRCGHGIAPPCSFPASLGCLYVLPFSISSLFSYYSTAMLRLPFSESPVRLQTGAPQPNPRLFKLVIEVWLGARCDRWITGTLYLCQGKRSFRKAGAPNAPCSTL